MSNIIDKLLSPQFIPILMGLVVLALVLVGLSLCLLVLEIKKYKQQKIESESVGQARLELFRECAKFNKSKGAS